MWAEAVRARLLHAHDLPASDAVYHQSCSVNFRTGKQIPQSYSTTETASKKMKTGRPQNKEKRDAFLATVQYLKDNDEELLLSISDLQDKMNDYLDNPELCAYGHTHMKEELLGHLKNEIVITEINGRSNVVTLKSTADSILQEFHKSQVANKSQEEEKQMIIQTAARWSIPHRNGFSWFDWTSHVKIRIERAYRVGIRIKCCCSHADWKSHCTCSTRSSPDRRCIEHFPLCSSSWYPCSSVCQQR